MTDQVETTVERKEETKPVQEEIQTANETIETVSNDNDEFTAFENTFKAYGEAQGIETSIEEKKTSEAETETKQEESTEETEQEVKTEDKTSDFDFNSIKVKRNGVEIPIADVIKEMQSNPELLNELQTRFDYTKKTQELSEAKKTFEEEKNKTLNSVEYTVLENLAYQLEMPPKTKLDFKNQLDKDGNYVYTSDEDVDKAFSEYERDFQGKLKVLGDNQAKTNAENQAMIDKFVTEYGQDKLNETVSELNTYLNPTVTRNQKAFPADTLEVFYKGKNFDKLVEKKISDAKTEARNDLLKELKEKGNNKITQNVRTETVKEKISNPEFDAFDKSFDMYASQRKLN